MGQNVNPIVFRIPMTQYWDSVWYAEKRKYIENLHSDLMIRRYIEKRFPRGGIVKIKIERFAEKMNVLIHTCKPGVIIGKRGANIEEIKDYLKKITNKPINIGIVEVKKSETIAQTIAENIVLQIEQRMPYRRAIKQAIKSAVRSGVPGIKVMIAGRLNGADMARKEYFKEGRIPLHTIKAKIEYAFREAQTTYGIIGVKVWTYHGDQVFHKENDQQKEG